VPTSAAPAVTLRRVVVEVEALVQPHGVVPVSKPLAKIASGGGLVTVSVAVRTPLVPVLQLPAASRIRARTV
jgi:hypothetical protein